MLKKREYAASPEMNAWQFRENLEGNSVNTYSWRIMYVAFFLSLFIDNRRKLKKNFEAPAINFSQQNLHAITEKGILTWFTSYTSIH